MFRKNPKMYSCWSRMYTATFVLFLLLPTVLCYKCANDDDPVHMKLKKNLLCNYDQSLRPVSNHKDAVKVEVCLVLKFFSFDHDYSTFDLDAWIIVFWKDEFLTWKPSDYDGINEIQLSNNDIWLPDLSIYNKREHGSNAAIDSATCSVFSSGDVQCVPPAHLSTLCVADLTRYPFDVQNCSLSLGSWVHKGEEINLTFLMIPIIADHLMPNGEWQLMNTTSFRHLGIIAGYPNDTHPSLTYNFIIKRLTGAHVTSVILPAIALMLLTLASLWISPLNSSRMLLCCLNLVCEFLYLQNLQWMLPNNGDKIPLVLLFGRDSLLLSTFAIIFSAGLNFLAGRKAPAPIWISEIVSFLLSFSCGRYMFLNDTSLKGVAAATCEEDGVSMIENQSEVIQNQNWLVFVKILDVTCFACYTIVYFGMFIAFTP